MPKHEGQVAGLDAVVPADQQQQGPTRPPAPPSIQSRKSPISRLVAASHGAYGGTPSGGRSSLVVSSAVAGRSIRGRVGARGARPLRVVGVIDALAPAEVRTSSPGRQRGPGAVYGTSRR